MRGYARENASDFNSPVIAITFARARSITRTLSSSCATICPEALISRRQRPAFCGGENGLSARMHHWDGWRIVAGGKTACDTLWFNENSGSQADCGIVEWFRSRMLMATAVSGTRSDVPMQ